MSDEARDFFEDQDSLEAYESFKRSVLEGEFRYFDVVEYESIIDFLLEEGDYETANLAIDQAMSIHPSALPVRVRYAQSLINKGDPESAVDELDLLENLDPYNPDLFLMRGTALLMLDDALTAEESFRKAIQLAGDDLDEIYYHIGSAYVPAGNLESAIRYFEKSFRENPENEPLLNDLGYFNDQLGFPAKSIYYYNLYLDLDAFNPAVWFNLGIAYNRTGEFEKALEAYDFTLALNSNFHHALFNKANSLANMERYKEAVEAYREYLKSDPANDDAWCYMGECYLNQGRYKMAERYYNKALDLNPENDIALFSKGIIFWVNRKYEESLTFIWNAIVIEDETPDYWFTYARVLADAGRRSEALNAFKRAAVLNPGNPEIWIFYAEYQHSHGNVKEAITILRKGIRHNNKDAVIKYHLAAYLIEANDEKEAAVQLETALKLDFNRHSDLFRVYPKAAQNDFVKRLIKSYTPLK